MSCIRRSLSRVGGNRVRRGLAAVAAAVWSGVVAISSAHAGGLLISDGNGVFRYSAMTGAFISTFAPGASGGMGSPTGMALRPDGTLYVSALATNSVRRYDVQTGAFLDTVVAPDSGGLSQPHGLAFGADGNLYVCSLATNSILRYDSQGASLGAFVPAGSGGLSQPWSLAFGADGKLYVTSSGSNSILRYNGTTGAFIDSFVPAGSGGLSDPQGIAFGPDNNLYVCSYNTDQVLRYDATTGAFLGVFVATGSGGLHRPTGLAFAPNGSLYVCSSDTGTVLRYDSSTGASLGVFVAAASGGLGQPQFPLLSPPNPPSDLSGTVVDTGRVDLAWADHSDDETAFAIWRKIGAGAWTRIAVVTPDTVAYTDLSVSPSTAYTYRVRSIGLSGASAWTNEVEVSTPAPTAPSAPTSLAATVISAGRVDLTWSDNSSNETAFAIWRKSDAEDWARIAVVVPNQTSYHDLSGQPGTAYTYRVRATNNTGASDWTNEVSVTTLAVPAAPTNLAAPVVLATQIKVTWTDNSTNEGSFDVWRKAGTGAYVKIAIVAANSTSYEDNGVTAGTTYSYKVRAYGQGVASGWTNEITVSPQAVPAAPTNLAASVLSPTQIRVTWQDNSTNEGSFDVWRKAGNGAYVKIAIVAANSTSYVDSGVTTGTSYSYKVRAYGSGGASGWTNEVSGITP
jgi:fibronectin type 3 domain-containing protein